jgi:GTP-binding protein EngB required for normal cell division
MDKTDIPIFAVMGHPNEGKSSVVSTLTEDDSVRISPFPGETRVCRQYPIKIDDREMIRFVDTPGFQQPRKTLEWLSRYSGTAGDMATAFIAAHRDSPDFSHEVELFSPLAQGAGIVFVMDGSRPLRQVDVMEMEILRLTGLPRMAVINTKEHARGEFFDEWKHEARKRFNTVRLFDAHRATFAERLELLESLKHIDPEWQPMLQTVIDAFDKEWQRRLDHTVSAILDLLVTTAGHSRDTTCREESRVPETRKRLEQKYREDIQRFEKDAHRQIRRQFRHNLFDLVLPDHSIVNEDLFSRKAWRILGLSPWQMTAAGAAGGGLVGAKIDLALAGHSLGAFTALGGLIGGGSAAMGARQATSARVKGLPLGRVRVCVGPLKNDQILFILLDRALIYFYHVSSWAHSRREPPPPLADGVFGKMGVTARWNISFKKIFNRFFTAARKGDWEKISALKPEVSGILRHTLEEISKGGFERLQIE